MSEDKEKNTTEEKIEPSEEETNEEEIITFGEEDKPPEVKDSSTIRHLRSTIKKMSNENRELRKNPDAEKPIVLGPRPTFESCGQDIDKFDAAIDAWHDKKSSAERQKDKVDSEQKIKDDAWQRKLDVHSEKSAALNVKDFDIAQEVVIEALSEHQQGMIVEGSENSAKVIYVLGQHPDLLKKMASIKNPVKFAAEIGKMESQIKTSKRRPESSPEKVFKSSGTPSKKDTQLETLRNKAAETGDFTEVHKYLREQKAKSA